MADEQDTTFPDLPVGQWWKLRTLFKSNLPKTVNIEYLISTLKISESTAKNTLPYEYDGSGAITGLIDKMLEKGFTPERTVYQAPQLPTQETVGNGNGKENEAHTCTIHNVEMKKYEKDSRSWYAHRNGDQWCNGKKK